MTDNEVVEKSITEENMVRPRFLLLVSLFGLALSFVVIPSKKSIRLTLSSEKKTSASWQEITPEMKTAGRNLCRVLDDVDPLDVEALFQSIRESPRQLFIQESIDLLLQWKSVTRASQMFVSTWGGLDISQVYNSAVRQTREDYESYFQSIMTVDGTVPANNAWKNTTARRMHVENALSHDTYGAELRERWGRAENEGMMHYMTSRERITYFPAGIVEDHTGEARPFWLLTPMELTLHGYFNMEVGFKNSIYGAPQQFGFLLSRSKNCPQRQYLIMHFHSYWQNRDNWGFIDELIRCGNYSEFAEACGYADDGRPNKIYHTVWPPGRGAKDMPPPEQLWKRLKKLRDEEAWQRSLGPDVTYTHVTDLNELSGHELVLSAVRSKHELARIGREMGNCVFDYAASVESGDFLLVKGRKSPRDDRPAALGLFDLKRAAWVELAGPFNKPLSHEHTALYKRYSETVIRSWLRGTSSNSHLD